MKSIASSARNAHQYSDNEGRPELRNSRITIPEIVLKLGIGRLTVYRMLKEGIIPGIRLGRLWIVTRHAYEEWERTCGMRAQSGLASEPEVSVLN